MLEVCHSTTGTYTTYVLRIPRRAGSKHMFECFSFCTYSHIFGSIDVAITRLHLYDLELRACTDNIIIYR